MRSRRHPAVRFVPVLRPEATQIEKELELADQKAHAARWSHAKRKAKKKQDDDALKSSAQGKSSLPQFPQ